MSMQQIHRNPIEKRKQEVRHCARNGAIGLGAGVAGAVALGWWAASSWGLAVICLVLGVAYAAFNWYEIQKIVNHKDEY